MLDIFFLASMVMAYVVYKYKPLPNGHKCIMCFYRNRYVRMSSSRAKKTADSNLDCCYTGVSLAGDRRDMTSFLVILGLSDDRNG